MPWVRFDDTFPVNRKVEGLSDAAFRLHVSAIFWCARNLTDGAVPEEDLELVTARVRAPARFAAELVRRGLWHDAGSECGSPDCSGPTGDGWVIHDYLGFQPSKRRVVEDREDNARRQREWRQRNRNGVSNAGVDTLVTAPRPVPDPTPKNKPSRSPAASDDDPDWAAFWDAYPRKASKGQARKAWVKAIKTADAATIIAAAKAYADQRRGQDQQYTAHPATWLNGERWTDQPAQPNPTPTRKPWEQ